MLPDGRFLNYLFEKARLSISSKAAGTVWNHRERRGINQLLVANLRSS
jgi:hypothetical protein